ncbi:diaminobutyrate--2-oxoglutarate transaminase [Pelagibius marinus]|uniref:diaminobutyrate--2-oxoglutarate transaminase n=1 Tax=Pelagibius marinus TaxID=2762760 RepID=UPI0018726EDC|nr:diaminobutyrate--2-oxoglutarate transaminase [Pelagibius marinus]
MDDAVREITEQDIVPRKTIPLSEECPDAPAVPAPILGALYDRLESCVRSYSRSFPTEFSSAQNTRLVDSNGTVFLDFFAGAGSLNYGHNHPALKKALIDYIKKDGVTQGLDMATGAKSAFLEAFDTTILQPRGLQYKIQFTGPTGANCVEAALKLARKVTGRAGIISFTNGFHGMSLGALSVTANPYYRNSPGSLPGPVTFMPYDGFLGPSTDTIDYIRRYLSEPGSGLAKPAAFIVETVQGEGGVNVASLDWLRRLSALAHEQDILLIIDDIQMGCGRTSPFFSFEPAEIKPDIVVLSKSLSGYGLPLSALLIRPALDIWAPGEHNGTFRGNNLAFVTATAAIKTFWSSRDLQEHASHLGRTLNAGLCELIEVVRQCGRGRAAWARGRGLIQAIDFGDPLMARRVVQFAFERGLLVETAGVEGSTVKLLPPLTSTSEDISAGLRILRSSVEAVLST